MACVRRAWLELNGSTLELEDDAAGYVCTELDLGYPEVREVMNNRPDADGADDRTQYFGGRAIAANIRARAGGSMSVDEISTLFAPYMLPAARPALHYVLDRPGAPERVCTVRASGYTGAISGSSSREIHLGWVAADPVMKDPAQRSEVAYSGSSAAPGRTYPLTFNRLYPPGGGTSSTGIISSPGDLPIRPLIRIYGPITNAHLALQINDPAPTVVATYHVYFVTGYVIGAGSWVDIDAAAYTVLLEGDPAQSVIDRIDWQRSGWPVLPVNPAETYMNLYGDSTAGATQAEAIWQDGYLT